MSRRNPRRDRRTGQIPILGAAPVWGREDLACPVSQQVVDELHAHARAHPWEGNTPLSCPAHNLTTTCITEPGRPLRILYSLDFNYHRSGWFANSDYETCYHLSFSHPRPDRAALYSPADVGRTFVGQAVETPSDDEARAWGRVFWREHATRAWFEPAVSVFDRYRLPGVVHLRLYIDQAGHPMTPTGEVYTLRPFADGSSPAKVTEGRAGADVR